MNAYVVILQKVVGTKQIIKPYEETKKVLHKKMTFDDTIEIPNIWENYYKNELEQDTNSQIYWIYQYINNIAYDIDEQEILKYTISGECVITHSIKNKMKKYQSIMDNIFIDKKTKREFITNVSKAQRSYRGFSKLGYLYKYKKAKLQITTNLVYDEIDPEHHNSIEIFHEGSRYLFTKHDLLKTIKNALINSPYHFAEPLVIKNPYNNMKFSKSILYTIYFRVIDNPLKFPVLFHNFVWLDFDLHLFRAENECLIREQYFREYIYNTTETTMINEIKNMLKRYFPYELKIHKDFPRKQLIKIFRPYYYLYLVANYHIGGLEKCEMASNYLTDKLYEFSIFNPNFGRKIYMNDKKTSHQMYKINFDMNVPTFTMNHAYNYHLHKKILESDDESDDTEFDEPDDNSVS